MKVSLPIQNKKVGFLLSASILLTITLIFQNFLYVDFSYKCNMTIIPSFELSNRNIIRSLKTLKKAIPDEYKKVCDNVHYVDSNISCGGFDGGCYKEGGKNTIFVTANQRDFVWTMAIISHETCHLLQEKEGRQMNESECYKKGDDVLKELTKY